MATRRAYRVAYDGRPFFGFQRQPDVPTAEDALLDALAALDVVDRDAGGGGRDTPPGYAAAGRTDRGVSAVRQTVAFDAPDWLTPRAFSSELPAGVRVWASADVHPEFHATHDAARRTYRYHLHAPEADRDRARDAAAALSGEHDVHNLTSDPRGPNTRRDLSVSVASDDAAAGDRVGDRVEGDADDRAGDEFLTLTVAAGGFPRECVRRIATVVRGVAVGDADLDRIAEVLGDEPVSGPRGVAAAAPDPLVLADVSYPGVAFEPDPVAVATLREVFSERRVDALARVRVFDDVLAAASE
ncbi:tRNA pseudouridine(38-40) synthase TruA [Halobaculum sp. CBA1158]|uniref:tRNA pseudouridine(38-40) synthase TruA n=1 Tax=Halobaculum sp. CBA1158 TaxID=2904243 RepID=UPI001F38BE1A|nr:tRNA pseudouridine(38-40) synthase TruA [Halobaculum sp. CBA1158]UIO99617.1 tRNA pseudouridine(38-40) synthase TruA [Halobaculum sp. CBA1158]